jgi:hypothetical protein|tara:strand:+ start:570 stop:1592 length:1023 start_codon:yes stop_codon:yes gene_type:complete
MAITNSDLEAFVRRALGFHNTADSATESLIDSCVEAATMAFFLPAPLPGENVGHIWSFLYAPTHFHTSAPYDTGTITISGTTVTGSGTVFPANATSGQLLVNDQLLEISARGGDTALTVANAPSANITSAASYQIIFIHYALPALFAGNIGDVVFSPGQGDGPLKVTSANAIESMHQNSSLTTGTPEYIAFNGVDMEGGSVIKIWPVPDASYQLHYTYLQQTSTKVINGTQSNTLLEDSQGDYLSLIPDYHYDTVYAALSVKMSEMFGVGEINGARQFFLQRMQNSVAMDRRVGGSRYGDVLGYNGDRSDGRYGSRRAHLYDNDVSATKYSDPLGLGRLL